MRLFFVTSILLFSSNIAFSANSRISESKECGFQDQLGNTSVHIAFKVDQGEDCHGIPSFDLDCTENIEGLDSNCVSHPAQMQYFESKDSKTTKITEAKIRILRSTLVKNSTCEAAAKGKLKKLVCVEFKLQGKDNPHIKDAVLPETKSRTGH